MFKSVLRRSEKNKIKAVFKLQFHAIQVPELGGDALVVSVVPADVGKPTVKLKKATIRDGSCYWDDPVYETVKFVRDPKSGMIHDKIYHFVLGAVKAGFVGEASIDMSSYVSSTKISSVSLPIKHSKSDILLQVSIQKMPDSDDQTVVDDSETAKSNSLSKSSRVHTSNGDMERSTRIAPVEDTQLSENINGSIKMNGNQRKDGMFDITMSHDDSSSEIHTVHQDSNGHLARESSTDESSGSVTEDNVRGGSSQMAEDIVFEKLKNDLTALSRQAETSDLELHALRKQVVKENRRGNDLAREIDKLKDERDLLKEECDKLKSLTYRSNEAISRNKVRFGGGDCQALLAELLEELDYEKDLNHNLRIQLEKTQESNSELLLAVRELDELLEQKDKDLANLSNQSGVVLQDKNVKCDADTDDEEQKALEELVLEHPDAKDVNMLEIKILTLQNEIETRRREKVEIEVHMEQLALDYEILKQENHDMSYKLEQSELKEQLNYESSSAYATVNELQTQVENLEKELNRKSRECSDSLNTIGELEVQVKDLENKLKKRSQEQSESLVTIKELENVIMNLEEELENQARGFEADLEALTRAKVEQEKRAIQAEERVRKMQWKNWNTAERLQEELRKLSIQLVSTFEANDTLATKAQAESSQLRLQKSQLEEELIVASESLEQYAARVDELASQVISKSRQVEELQLMVDEKSNQLDHEAKHAEEIHKHLTREISSLKARLETLSTEKKVLAKQIEDRESLISELDHMRRSFDEVESLLENALKENMELETINVSVKVSGDESLRNMMWQKNENEPIAKNLELEIGSLKAECNELRQLLSENELETENLRKQARLLKPGGNRKEDSFNNIKRKPTVSIGQVSRSDGAKVASKDKLQPVSRGKNDVATLKEKIKLLEGLLKQKESAFETSSKSFLSREKELQKKYEELEQRLEVFTSYMAIYSQQYPNQERKAVLPKQVDDASENLNNTNCLMGGSAHQIPSISSNLEDSEAGKGNELLREMELLKKKNKQTEIELNEMQERYSEISLKFAEVEGERQQLVMKIRNLKKNPSAL